MLLQMLAHFRLKQDLVGVPFQDGTSRRKLANARNSHTEGARAMKTISCQKKNVGKGKRYRWKITHKA